ncbi:heavy metal efflux pump, CzcA family [Williamwhitmania taraxaci]|uniref:Heavy metal efflux pump, CzcA family n=2 Tax=Williamwhitmania taraxaci TaxID=1640674 RepID=A0A1G6RAV7_9BACT|nr:heavy metal efflux pump, CzcA family [Williamwhitmania taraxaci]
MIVLLTALVVMIAGVKIASDMDVDVFPDITAPTVVVMTDAHGMAVEEVERLVTFPIETAVNGATDVRRVRSASSQGYSFVWVEFDWGTDVFKARQIVSEKMVTVSSTMPEGIGQPTLAPQSSVMGEVLFVGLQADSTSMQDLRTIAEWNIQPVLLATGGVAQVTIIGGDYKEYQILADPIRMLRYGVSLEELTVVCRGISQNSQGGVVRQYGNEYVVRGMARTNNLEQLGASLIKMRGNNPVRINDVAEVKIGAAVKMGYASQDAKPAVILSISKQPNANTLNLTENIEQRLADVQKTLPPDVRIDTKIFRQADFIETSINNVQKALVEGGILVVIILFLFLMNFRTTIISLTAIPLSLLGAIIVLKMLNLNINTMSLGGMAIAIGSLVDDAIIDVENVYKRLRENYRLPKTERKSPIDIVFRASREIRASIVNATIIIIVAFIPLFFLSGMEGRMLKPLGIAYIVALFTSLIVAITVTPVLCYLMLSNEKRMAKHSRDPWLSRKLSELYASSLSKALHYKRAFIGTAAALTLVSVVLLLTMGSSFLPEFNEGALTISAVSKPGISLEESNNIGNMLERAVLTIPEVTETSRRTGRGELDEHSQSTNSAEIDINFILKDRPQEEFLAEVRAKLGSVPGVAFTVGQPLGHRIDHMISGTRANIAIKLFGTDLSRLYLTGKQIEAAINGIPGLVDVNVDQQTEVPQIQIVANRERLAYYGITVGEFTKFVELAFSGEKVSEIYEGQRSFNLTVKLNRNYTSDFDGIRNALIDTPNGKKIPLEQVATIKSAMGPSSISRENVQRKLVISANVTGGDLGNVVKQIKEQVSEKVTLPEGYRVEYGGQFESAQAASRTLLLSSIIALLVIFLLLYHEFKDSKLAGIVLINLPLALIGGVFAIWITSGVVSIPAIIGFITLFGIATRNGILLISHYKLLESRGTNLTDIIVQGSVDRLNPILMTALTAGLALIPLVLNGNVSGNEIQSPMAKVILGGLLTSTLLNLYIVPMVYQLFKTKKENNVK